MATHSFPVPTHLISICKWFSARKTLYKATNSNLSLKPLNSPCSPRASSSCRQNSNFWLNVRNSIFCLLRWFWASVRPAVSSWLGCVDCILYFVQSACSRCIFDFLYFSTIFIWKFITRKYNLFIAGTSHHGHERFSDISRGRKCLNNTRLPL